MHRVRSYALSEGANPVAEWTAAYSQAPGMDTRGSGELLIWSEAGSGPTAQRLRACFHRTLRRNGFEIDDIDGTYT